MVSLSTRVGAAGIKRGRTATKRPPGHGANPTGRVPTVSVPNSTVEREKEDSVSTRTRFFDAIAGFFDFGRDRYWASIMCFLFATLSFGCLVNGAYDFVAAFFARPTTRWSALWEMGRPAFVSLGLCVLVVLVILLVHWRRGRVGAATTEGMPPEPHPGLIVTLSPYWRGKTPGAPASACDLATELYKTPDLFAPGPDGSPSLWSRLMGANWGPLAVAVKHHAPQLRHCWIVCSGGKGGSASEYGVAERLVHAIAGSKVRCHPCVVSDANDIKPAVAAIQVVYHDALVSHDLRPDEIIADFTGGTAAMSGAMVLATVWEECHVEYLRQDRKLVKCVNGSAVGLSWEEIEKLQPLVAIHTTPAFLPQGSPAEA